MKQLEKAKDIYLKEYEVNVHPYLTLEQIDLIVKGICEIDTNEFADRKMCEDGLILFYATDMVKEEIESIPYEDLVGSGLIKAVKDQIGNIGSIQEGLNYAESLSRSLTMLAPKIMPLFEKIGELNGENSIKKH